MTPANIALVLVALAVLDVVLTRKRLAMDTSAGHTEVPPGLVTVHTVAGSAAVVAWLAMVVLDDRLWGWVSLPLWWTATVAGLLILVRWMPARGRHSTGPRGDSWGDGPGLSVLAHVGMLLGTIAFSAFVLLDKVP